jgi:hypothetical protein
MVKYGISVTTSKGPSDGLDTVDIFYDGDYAISLDQSDFHETIQDTTNRPQKSVPIRDPQGLVKLIESCADPETIHDALMDRLDDAISGLGWPYTIHLNTVTAPKPKKRIHNYRLRGAVMNLPYVNYGNNVTDDRCVLNYATPIYGARIKKIGDYFDKDFVHFGDVIKFVERYNITCRIYNILGKRIYSHEEGTSTKLHVFAAVLVNGHLYPHESGSYQPTLSQETIAERDRDPNDILIYRNQRSYIREGVFRTKMKDGDGDGLDSEFFLNFPPNFTYLAEERLKSLSMRYTHPYLASRLVNEIDMNAAYYTTAYKLIDHENQYPIFTPMDMWEANDSEEIRPLSYYLISRDSLEHLMRYFPGIFSNFMNGFLVEYFLRRGYIQLEDVEARKHPHLLGDWHKILDRIKALMDAEGSNVKDFPLYNGCLGRSMNSTQEYVAGIDQDEDLGEGWEPSPLYKNVLKKDYCNYRYLNLINVYNHIIGHHTLFMLETIDRLRKTYPKARVMKISTDSIGLDCRIAELPEHFKFVKEPKLKVRKSNLLYHDWRLIRDGCLNELLEHSKWNTAYTGAPGSGKTYKVQHSQSYDHACSNTNVCSLNIGGATIFKLLGLYSPEELHKKMGKFRNKTIWIDEFSMVPAVVWSYLAYLSINYNTRFIFSGDTNQIPPVGESGIDLKSDFFRIFFNEIEVLADERRNDQEIVKLRTSVLAGDPQIEYSEVPIHTISRHLVYTNRCKSAVNVRVLRSRNLTFSYGDGAYTVSNGVRLQPRLTVLEKGFYKGDLWEVTDENTLTNVKSGEVRAIKNGDFKYMALGFAMTTHSAQGLTVSEPLMIHQWKTMLLKDRRLLYTAVSRSTVRENLYFAPPLEDGDLAPIDYVPLPESKLNYMDQVHENLM